MRKSVLICDDKKSWGESISDILTYTHPDIPVICVRHIDEAQDVLFSDNPPAVFITDLRGTWTESKKTYESIRRRINEIGEKHGDKGIPGLIRDVQQTNPDTRIILISGISPIESARQLGIFGYADKRDIGLSYDNFTENFPRICTLGPLQKTEIDSIGKLREGPLNLCNKLAVRQYIERKFPVTRERET